MNETVYYHGGVPGKRPGDRIVPATMMGLDYTRAYSYQLMNVATKRSNHYRPDLAYFTTHLGVARGYAARYGDVRRGPVPGDVYRVDLKDVVLEPDPDFNGPGLDQVYVATGTPVTITAVVERRVVLVGASRIRRPGRTCGTRHGMSRFTPVTAQCKRLARCAITVSPTTIWRCCRSGCTTTSLEAAADCGLPGGLVYGRAPTRSSTYFRI